MSALFPDPVAPTIPGIDPHSLQFCWSSISTFHFFAHSFTSPRHPKIAAACGHSGSIPFSEKSPRKSAKAAAVLRPENPKPLSRIVSSVQPRPLA